MTRMLYLAGPVDFVDPEDQGWRQTVHEIMMDEPGWVLYDPQAAFTMGPETPPNDSIATVNWAALNMSNACVASIPDDVRTIGVPMEIEYFLERNLPVAIVGGGDARSSWSLGGGVLFVDTWDEACAYAIGAASNLERDAGTITKVRLTHADARVPTKTYEGDAAFDLYCCKEVTVMPRQFVDVPCGVEIEPPDGVWFRIIGRSSTFRKRGLLCVEGTVDEGYRGELFAAVYNIGEDPVKIAVGERICQMIPMYNAANGMEMVRAFSLSASERGTQGFGSTGK